MAGVFVQYYIHPDSVGMIDACEQVFAETTNRLQQVYETIK